MDGSAFAGDWKEYREGDHGPGSLLDWETVEATCLWERTSILSAYYLPGSGVDLLYPEITPVNTFRLIFSHYLGASLDLLPDRVHYASFVHRPPVVDVTGKSDSKSNCAPPE